MVDRQGDVSCYNYDACACAESLGVRRDAAVHPDGIRTVHSLTSRYSKYSMFSACV